VTCGNPRRGFLCFILGRVGRRSRTSSTVLSVCCAPKGRPVCLTRLTARSVASDNTSFSNDTPFMCYTHVMNLVPCGTLSAYARHIRRKELSCQPCKDANATRRRDYYKKNSKRIYAQNRKWASKNPEKTREYSRNTSSKRKAQKKSNGHTPYTNQQIFDLYGTNCHICKIPVDLTAPRQAYIADGWELGLHFDHLIPLSKGGPDTLENIRPSHALCNIKKRNS